jgi:hypothetical protein
VNPPADHAFIVQAYGDSPFLQGCLSSLRAQTTSSRVLVSTSTPRASIREAARACDAEMVVNSERRGIGADWNFALGLNAARYVTLAHQDDLYAPPFAERTLALFRRHGGALCFTGYHEIDDAGRPRTSRLSLVKHALAAAALGRRETPGPGRMRAFLAFGNPLPCSSVTFDLQTLSAFRFSEELASNLDWDAWLRLAGSGVRFLHAPERLVGRRHNALTETRRLIGDGRRRREDEAMFARIWPAPIGRLVAAAYRAGY